MNTQHHNLVRSAWLLAMGVMLCLVGCSEQTTSTAVRVTTVALETAPAGEEIGWRLTGVGSCTASGCHGSAKPHEILGSEYNIWISADPHAQAHSVLYDDQSLQMVQKLDGNKFNPAVPPYEDQRCLTCHSTTFAAAVDEAGEIVTDGVGCEACHGPAEGWLAEHYLPGFDDAARERLGMWDTKDLYSRAQICASCHVGSPGREVNHDLIAAGHPRLQFEMGAYLQALPKHWDERRDRERSGGNFEFLTWALGQTATSRAALMQLEHRAAQGPIWPELSEWSCGACHHDLLDTAKRQETLAATGGLSGQTIRWDDWNHHLVREHAGLIASALGKSGSADKLQEQLAEMAKLAGSLSADRQQVAAAARATGAELDAWAKQIQAAPVDLNALNSLMRSLVQTYERGVADTSEAMLVYDALATLQQSRLDTLALKNIKPTQLDQAITANLAQMFDALTKADNTPIAELTRVQNMTTELTELAKLLQQQEPSE
ncbi:MAG: multiheme c-type cytochrome [Bythopirellula sp.]|nr:multiheme c-type cytochrome [Bythopirellula sp.]